MANRGFLNHIWYKLLDEEGVPVESANVYIYTLNLNLVTIYESDGLTEITQPLVTTSGGVFDFFVKDDIGVPSGSAGHYAWDTQYIVSWSKDDKSGVISNDRLFGAYAKVDETDATNTRINKAMSNYLGWVIQDHIDFMFGTTPNCGSSSSSSSSVSSSSSSSSSVSSSSSSSSSSSVSSSSSTVSPSGAFRFLSEDYPPSAGSFTISQSAPLLIDGDRENIYSAAQWSNKESIGLGFSIPVEINGLDFWVSYANVSYGTGWLSPAYGTFDVYKSNDNITYEFIQRFVTPPAISGAPGGYTGFRCNFTIPQTAKWFKIHPIPNDVSPTNNPIMVVDGSNEVIRLNELEIYTI